MYEGDKVCGFVALSEIGVEEHAGSFLFFYFFSLENPDAL